MTTAPDPLDLLEAIRAVSPPGLRPDVDAALSRAEATARDSADRLHQLYRAMAEAAAPTTRTVVDRRLAGELEPPRRSPWRRHRACPARPRTALRTEAERQAARATRDAVEAAADTLPEDYATAAVAGPWQAWTTAAERLAALLERHGVEASAAAVVDARPPSWPPGARPPPPPAPAWTCAPPWPRSRPTSRGAPPAPTSTAGGTPDGATALRPPRRRAAGTRAPAPSSCCPSPPGPPA